MTAMAASRNSSDSSGDQAATIIDHDSNSRCGNSNGDGSDMKGSGRAATATTTALAATAVTSATAATPAATAATAAATAKTGQ
jgi:hypothetical protein